MNLHDEKRLRAEVIYPHHLSHQNSNPNPPKRPRLFTQSPSKKPRNFAASGSDPPPKPDHGHDWSIFVEPPSPPSSGWPEPKAKPDPETTPVSAEELAKFSSLQMQKKVLESCREFFKRRVRDEEDDDDSEEDEEESEVDKFFMEIFVNIDELRGYYDENHEKGEFFCLVCGGIGENVGKKFKGCAGLVQHCMSISKTKKRTSHRAFGTVVCKVLGWDVNRWPVILLNGEPLSHTLANSRESKGDDSNKNAENLENKISDMEVKKGASDSLDTVDNLNVMLGNTETMNADGRESVEREVSSIDQSNNGELIIHENSLMGDDSNRNNGGLEISDAEPNNGAINEPELESAHIKSAEWPCIEPAEDSASTAMGWPSFKPCTTPVTCVVSAEEQARFNMVQLQQTVFEACKQFLSTTAGSDSDEDEDEDEDDLMGEDGSKECREFNFFLRLFTENNELRKYYETNCRGGDFCCLVCCGIGKKAWRTFKDCVGLLQHSTAISKTKKKQAHRAFALVICKVLGWDIDCLPSIVLKGEPQNHTLEDLSECQHDGNSLCDKDESYAPADKIDSEALKEGIDAHENNTVLMSSETSLIEEHFENRTLNIEAKDTAVNSLNLSMENSYRPKADNAQLKNSGVDEPKPEEGCSQSKAETS